MRGAARRPSSSRRRDRDGVSASRVRTASHRKLVLLVPDALVRSAAEENVHDLDVPAHSCPVKRGVVALTSEESANWGRPGCDCISIWNTYTIYCADEAPGVCEAQSCM